MFTPAFRLAALLAAAAIITGPLAAQVPLSSGTYVQTFDAIGSGLPAGWSVTTGATASALGTTAAFDASTSSNWSVTTGSWRNSAAADNPGFTATTATAAQAAATDRALGIRQTGAFGDPGAAANFNFSTIGLQVTSISFSAQMLSVQTRSTTWSLQYGLGAVPSTWTTVASYSDPAVFGATTMTASGFGTALDNQSNVWLRIVALVVTSGSGSRDTFGIDDFTIVTTGASGPVPPGISTPPAAQTVTEGGTAQFTVVASGTAPLSYQWRKGTTALSDGGIVSGAATDTLTLTGVALADAGNYNVVVTNAGGSATSADAVLTVNPVLIPPGITIQPTPQSVAPGGTATFNVVAAGTAPLAYQWFKGGSSLADGGNISGATTATLTIAGVGAADVGNYNVVVSNAANPPATSNAVALSLAAIITPTGQISYAGGAYTQNFDTLPAGGTFTLPNNGPFGLADAPVLAGGLGGWSFAKYEGTGTVALFRVDAGSSTSGSVYSYGTGTATDRALGLLASGTTIARFGSALVNNTGQTITQFTLSYTGEEWRRGSAAANKLTFEYATDATDINTGTFTAAPALDFTAPNTTGTSVAVDGNAAANRTAVSATVTGLNWAPGQTLTLRWTDVNDSGNDDGLAVDDLSFTTPIDPSSVIPAVAFTNPAGAAVDVPVASPVTVAFNEPVEVTGSWFTLTGSVSGPHSASVSGGPTEYTLTPAVPFSEGETVTLTVLAAQVTDVTTGTRHPQADYSASFITFSSAPLPIHTVQGSGLISPYVNHVETVQGVVTATFQAPGMIGGYFIETPDADQDADPATSEGIYVFDNTNSVTVGDFVTVRGTVTEFGTAPATDTEISSVTSCTISSSGNPLPTPVSVTLPFPSAGYAERYEGMRLTLPQTLTVTDNFDLGSFGELLLSNGRLSTPTNVVTPGAAAQALEAANLLNQVILDDGVSTTNPDPTPYLSGSDPATATRRTGSTTTGVTGVLANKFGVYVVEPTAAPVFVEANPRGNAPASAGSLRIAIGNVENFMNGDGLGGGFPTSRGASSYAEFQRQLPKVTAGILNLAPDIMGLTEIENDRVTNGAPDSYGPNSAIAQLVASLNAGAPAGTTYAFINAAAVDVTTDQIHVALIYRTQAVEPVGLPAMLNDPAFNDLARNPLAQTFRQLATGGKLTVCINHLRAKGGAATGAGNNDSGDGQGTNNALRVQEANALTAWLATDPTGSGDPDFLIIGDLNAYAKEDPIVAIENAGYASLTERFEGAGGYSYSFNGEFGHLDHALATASLNAQVLSAATWHVNSDEPVYYDYNLENKSVAQQAINAGTPYRYSDHDPVVIGVDLTAAPVITAPPSGQTVTVGDPVTFSVTATGNPAPAYQWRKNGNPISGANSASYTMVSAVTADAGGYDVVVSNSVGSATSDAASLTVNKAAASIVLGNLATVYSGAPQAATATTNPVGLAVAFTYDGNAAAPANAGSYAVTATINDVNYFGTASGTLTIAKGVATVTLGSLSQTYDGTPKPATATTIPSGVSASLTYDGNAVVPTNAGSYAVVATVNDANYTGSASGTLTINRAVALVTLGNLAQVFDGTPKPVTVTTSPTGLAVTTTYNSLPTPPTNVGSYAVAATASDANHAGSAAGTLVISTAGVTVTLDDLLQTYDGTPKAVTVVTSPAGLPVAVTYGGSSTVPTYPGSYPVVATITDPNHTGSASGTLVIAAATLVRHAPTLNGGVDGSVQVLLPESTTLNGSAIVSGDLLLPGTPAVQLNGHPVYGGTIDGPGSSAPATFTVTLNGNAVLRHVIRRINAVAMSVVAAPPAPTGTRSVSLNNAGQTPGDFATLRNLTLNGNGFSITVPAGTYGSFTLNGNNVITLGVAGAVAPAVYNLQGLTLNGTSQVKVVGPVTINLASGVTLNGSIGASAHPEWLTLNLATGGLTLNSNVSCSGFVVAPNGSVIINGNSTLTGGAVCDRLTINGNGLLSEVEP